MKKLLSVMIILSLFLFGCMGNNTHSPMPTDSPSPGPYKEVSDINNTKGMTEGIQTLTYWKNFPEKGEEYEVDAYGFFIKSVKDGVSVSGYDEEGNEDEELSVSYINNWIFSYNIKDKDGNILLSSSSSGGVKEFSMNINISGGCNTDLEKISFVGYHKNYKGDSAVVLYQDVDVSFNINKNSASWIYSEDFSEYSEKIIKIEHSDGSLKINVNLKRGETIYLSEFSQMHFVYLPEDKLNNDVPIVLLNINDEQAYKDLMENTDKSIKNTWFEGTYTVVSDISKALDRGDNSKGLLRIKRRGFSSFEMPKKSYTLKLDEKQSIDGMEKNKDWVLVANYSDKTLLRNYFTYTIGKSMNSMYVSDCRTVDVYITSNKGTVCLGTYLLAEKIETAKEKINIDEMNEADTAIKKVDIKNNTYEEIMAGAFLTEIEMTERVQEGDMIVDTVFPLSIKSPDEDLFIPSEFPARNSIHNATQNKNLVEYIDSFFNITDNSIYDGTYDQYIDIDSFVDYYIINELAKNIDGNLRLSTYFYKDRGGKMKITVWDFDLSYGNCNYETAFFNTFRCWETEGFFIKEFSWFNALMQDEYFSNRVRERWDFLRRNILSDKNIESIIDDQAKSISSSVSNNFKIWDILDVYVWPNSEEIQELITYQEHVEHLKSWIKERAEWLDINL